jgi:tRNA(adenine34) deaminase
MNYELFMGEALAEARQAGGRGAPAVGAIAVMNEAMVARGANRVTEANDPTAHAVVATLREASRKLGTTHLSDVTIFTTLEPCPMCVGAMLESDVAALVFAMPNPIDGAAG